MIGDSCDMWAGGGVFIVVIGDNDNDNVNCGVCVCNHSNVCHPIVCHSYVWWLLECMEWRLG